MMLVLFFIVRSFLLILCSALIASKLHIINMLLTISDTEPSTSTADVDCHREKLLQRAPVVPYGSDLCFWGDNFEVPLIVRLASLSTVQRQMTMRIVYRCTVQLSLVWFD